jgi:Domain of unknown function (DUF4190)
MTPPAAAPPPPPPPSYAPQYQYQYAPGRPVATTNGLAVASLVLGIISLCGIGSILAVIFGYVGKGQIDRSGGTQSGRGMAIAGIVLGWIGIGILAIFIVLGIIGALNGSGSSQQALFLL